METVMETEKKTDIETRPENSNDADIKIEDKTSAAEEDKEQQNVLVVSEIIIQPAPIINEIPDQNKDEGEVSQNVDDENRNLNDESKDFTETTNSSIIPTSENSPCSSQDKEGSEQLKEENDNSAKKSVSTETSVNVKSTALGILQSQYSDSDTESDSGGKRVKQSTNDGNELDSSDSEAVIVNDKDYRNQVVEIDSEDSSSDSDVEVVNDDAMRKKILEFEANDDDDMDYDENAEVTKKRSDPLRVKGELLLDELPPIQDLHITVPEEECVELGKIHSIVDQLVLVDSIPETVTLNLETVLFLNKGQKVLGKVFDVLGQITNPLYCIRFNSNKQIMEKQIKIGEIVYVAPRTEHTQFVILSEIMKVRGSDASWKNDVEPSPKHIDFSDDEEEKNYRRSFLNKEHNNRSEENNEERKRSRTFSSASSQISDTSSVSSYTNYHNGRYQRSNNRFSRPYRQNRQFQPRNQPMYNNTQLQHPPAYNYDLYNNSWHTNYNFNDNLQNGLANNSNYQQSYNQYPNQPPQYYGGNLNTQGQSQFLQQNLHQNAMPSNSSFIYPNPYAMRAPFIQPNLMQQPLFPPQPPPNPEN